MQPVSMAGPQIWTPYLGRIVRIVRFPKFPNARRSPAHHTLLTFSREQVDSQKSYALHWQPPEGLKKVPVSARRIRWTWVIFVIILPTTSIGRNPACDRSGPFL